VSSGANIYYSSGFVGIGQPTPAFTLDVGGNINSTGAISYNYATSGPTFTINNIGYQYLDIIDPIANTGTTVSPQILGFITLATNGTYIITYTLVHGTQSAIQTVYSYIAVNSTTVGVVNAQYVDAPTNNPFTVSASIVATMPNTSSTVYLYGYTISGTDNITSGVLQLTRIA
jgi:hypothetical protein